MKKILFLLLPILGFSQTNYTISPHYNKEIILNTPHFQQQDVTYNDLNSVVFHFKRVLENDMGLVEKSVSEKLDKNFNGVYTYVYSEGVAINQPMKRITFNYKVSEFNNLIIVESVNIVGNYILATKFYVRAFQTQLNFKDTKNGIIVYNNGYLDDMTFQYKNNLGIINIKNRQIKSLAEFEKYRENSKEQHLISKAEFDKNKVKEDSIDNINELKKETEKLRQKEFLANKMAEPKPLPKISDVVYATKKNDKISINEKYSSNLLSSIKGCLSSQKNGLFSIYFKNINDEMPTCENIRKVK